MRRHLAALALLSVLASPVPASAQAVITWPNASERIIPGDNDFVGQLNALNYNYYASTGASISLLTESVIDFYFLGAESGFENSFLDGGGILQSFVEHNENTLFNGVTDLSTGSSVFKFSRHFDAGILTGPSFAGGLPATIGQSGFGIFLKDDWLPNNTSGAVNRFIIGYDDDGPGDINHPTNDNHDDLMVLAVVRSVPEPGTWATLLFGFGALGAVMRRKSKAPRFRAAIA